MKNLILYILSATVAVTAVIIALPHKQEAGPKPNVPCQPCVAAQRKEHPCPPRCYDSRYDVAKDGHVHLSLRAYAE